MKTFVMKAYLKIAIAGAHDGPFLSLRRRGHTKVPSNLLIFRPCEGHKIVLRLNQTYLPKGTAMNSLRYLDFGASRDLLLIARIAIVLLFILSGYPKCSLRRHGSTWPPSAPMPAAAIIAIVMEVPRYSGDSGVLTRRGDFLFYTLGTAIGPPPLLEHDRRCGDAKYD